jgi:hypothetical protein
VQHFHYNNLQLHVIITFILLPHVYGHHPQYSDYQDNGDDDDNFLDNQY